MNGVGEHKDYRYFQKKAYEIWDRIADAIIMISNIMRLQGSFSTKNRKTV